MRSINPGMDFTSKGSKLNISITCGKFYTGKNCLKVFTARIDAMAVIGPELGTIQTRFLTPTLGYFQNAGIFLSTGFTTWESHVKTNAWSYLDVPKDKVVMISVVFAGLGSLPPSEVCQHRVELYEGNMNKTVWRLCSRYHSLPEPHLSYKDVHVHFVSDVHEDTHLRGLGFRIVFTFHDKSDIPVQLTNDSWNCSTSTWLAFRSHFSCDLIIQCAGGEDEASCSSYTQCGYNGILRHGKCYSMERLSTGATWHKANALCSSLGPRGRLVPSAKHILNFLKLRLLDNLIIYSGHMSILGVSTAQVELHLTWTDVHDKCSKYVCYGICETDAVSKNETTSSLSIASQTVLPSATCFQSCLVPFPHVACDGGHITHAFLSMDQQTRCFRKATSDHTSFNSVRGWSLSASDWNATSFPALFTCKSEAQHVHYTLVCDHRQDCQDDSDEDFCYFPPCDPSVHFQCESSHECQPIHVKCNYQPDCLDASDERDCRSRELDKENQKNSPFFVDLEGHYGYPVIVKSTFCPKTHYVCIYNKNCLPIFTRCNGVADCSLREDEQDCEKYVCPGLYRCRGYAQCVLPRDLCDGVNHCLQHDDERFCNISCPDHCMCLGHAFVCRQSFDFRSARQLRYLDARGSRVKPEELAENKMLIYLSLAQCNVVHLSNLALPNLNILDLSDNGISTINLVYFLKLEKLHYVKLSGNPLTSLFAELDSGAARQMSALQTLDMSKVKLKTLYLDIIAPFSSLRLLNLSESDVSVVQDTKDHTSLPSTLRELDVRGSNLKEFPSTLFQGADKLQAVYADTYKLCCPAMLPRAFAMDNCHAPADEISSCDSLLRLSFYRGGLSVLATFGLLGNSISFIVRLCVNRAKRGSGFGVFVQHLCVSDFLMAVYLVFIGVADRLFLTNYLWEDTSWRHSAACKLAGYISLTSCEVSSFIICLITVDRFLVLRFPFSQLRFRFMSAQIASVIAWAVGGALAAVPLLPAAQSWQFYSQTGICIPLPVTRQEFAGHSYAFGVMIVLNFLLFVLIAGGQISIYASIQASKMSEGDTGSKSHDAAIARRLITVVVSDFFCWFPVGLLGLLASSGTPIPGTVNVVIAIFVLPLSAALNPFLYTLNMVQERFQKRKEAKMMKILMHQI